MILDINVWAVLVAAVANIAIGFAWYHPSVFGGVWMTLIRVTPEMMEQGQKRMASSMAIAFVASILIALAFAYLFSALFLSGIAQAVLLAFVVWLGFFVPTLVDSVLWEQRPWRLFLINTSYRIVGLIAIAIITALIV